MENNKYKVYYKVPGSGGSRSAVIDAPDISAAKFIAKNTFGEVSSITREETRQPLISSFDPDDDRGALQTIGRDLARQHLGVIGDSLSDESIGVLVLLVLALPVVALWLGVPVYRAMLLAPTIDFPPLTVCVTAGIVAFLMGWIILYVCPTVLLRVVGLVIYPGWIIYYVGGRIFDLGHLERVLAAIITTNTDVANLQKAGLVVAGLIGGSVIGNLGMAVRRG